MNEFDLWRKIYEYDPAFIVRAVNAHDHLIAAVEKLIAYDDMDPDCSVDMILAYNEAIMLARAALSAAKE